jgi:hypothetical protein
MDGIYLIKKNDWANAKEFPLTLSQKIVVHDVPAHDRSQEC